MKKLIKMGLLSLCLTMFMTVQTLAAGTTFDTTGAQEGEFIEISVAITEGTAYSGEMVIEYDVEELELAEALKGADAGDSLILAVDTEPGKITIGFADVTKTVQGEILKLKFRVLETNDNNAYVVNVDVEEWSGEEINDEVDALAYENYDVVVKDGEASIINMDADGDGTPDVNVDTDGDGAADINIDTTGDGEADSNLDTNGDGVADTNIIVPDNGGNDDDSEDTGNEGNTGGEGDEGDEGNTGNEGDEGDEGNTGNEGDEGDEGNTGNEGDEGDEGKDEGKDDETNAGADQTENKTPVWPFVAAGVVIVIAIVGFFVYKKKVA